MSEQAQGQSPPTRTGRLEPLVAGLAVIAMVAMVAAFMIHVFTINYADTPVSAYFPPKPVAGTATVTLGDGTEVTVSTRGFESLTPEELAAHRRVQLRVRGFQSAERGGATQLWVNAIDEDGRVIRHLEKDDFEVHQAERPVPHFDFMRKFSERPPSFASPHIWIANSDEDTVSKLSTRTGKEEGRYKVGDNPSRTSVDLDGNAYVAARDSDELTKVQAAGCEGQDCVLYSVPTCKGARGLAVNAANRVWVGGKSLDDRDGVGCLMLHDGRDGRVLRHLKDLPGTVYGLVLDQDGVLWGILAGSNSLIKISRSGRIQKTIKPPATAQLYGIAVDHNGNLWFGNNKANEVSRYRPQANKWDTFKSPNVAESRGLAADVAGNIWVANSVPSTVSRFNADDGKWIADYPTGKLHPVGVAIDADQFVWTVNKDSDMATRLDPETGDVVGEYRVGKGPYTYSDMTGYALNNFVTAEGSYRLDYHPVPFALSLVRPEDGSTLPAVALEPRTLAVKIDTFDPHDPVASVTYFVDDVKVGVSRKAPFDLPWEYKKISAGAHQIRAVGKTVAGFTDEDTVTVYAVETSGQVLVRLVRQGEPIKEVPRVVELVMDSSGSMWGVVDGDGRRKIEVAKEAVLELLESLPDTSVVALRAYGHRSKRCTDTELLVGPGSPRRPELVEAVKKLRPRGRTPIAHALEEAAKDLTARKGEGYLGERMVVLVTDGLETCKGAPCDVAQSFADKGLRLRASVIGFGLERGADTSSLSCIAKATGGIYADADDARELTKGLRRAIRVAYNIVDEEGKVVHVGSLDRPHAVLPVGRYRVRFGAKGQGTIQESELFVLESDQRVTVQLELQADGPPVVSVVRR